MNVCWLRSTRAMSRMRTTLAVRLGGTTGPDLLEDVLGGLALDDDVLELADIGEAPQRIDGELEVI